MNRETILFAILAITAGMFVVSRSDASITDFYQSNDNPGILTNDPVFEYTDSFTEIIPEYEMTTENNTDWKTNDYPLYASIIAQSEINNGIPVDLLARLLYEESRYNPKIINGTIKSNKGALGIAQFMPATAAEMHINPLDPYQAIPAAAIYLRRQYNALGNWQAALGAYNWGGGNYRKYLSGQKTLPTETRNYIAQITDDVPVA